MKKIAKYIALLVIIASVFSCSEYNKILKSSDYEKKYEYAKKLYEKDDYPRALTIFEELIAVYRGTSKAEEIFYYYAYCHYYVGDYVLSAYHFKTFIKTFPNSVHVEEAAYMIPSSYYEMSPTYSLDQTDTKNAIRELQSFINTYSTSTRIPEANETMAKLRGKLEKKYYENAKQYFNMEEYSAAVTAFNNLLKDYPDNKYREEVSFLIIKSNYLYALNSIEAKKSERFQSAIESYFKFLDKYPASQYLKQAETIYEGANKEKSKINNKS